MYQRIGRRIWHTITVWPALLAGCSSRLTRIASQRTRLHIFYQRFASGRRVPTAQQLIGLEAYWTNFHLRPERMNKAIASNQAASGNGEMASRFHVECLRRAVPEQRCWAR